MKSIENGEIIILTIYGLILLINGNDIVRNEDICGFHNGRRLYLELGEKGILYAKNVSFTKNLSRHNNQIPRQVSLNNSHDQCSIEIVTCPSCAITLTFKSLALSHTCADGGILDSPCRCDYILISEPPYEDSSGTPYCGFYSSIIYRSSTRTVSITLLYSQPHQHAFTIEYTSERNRVHLKGSDSSPAKGFNGTTGGILTSPFFPSRYPRDLGIEYIITCPNEAPCKVRVLFSDFQLATVSIIEFYDWNGQRLDVSSGARFRPPIIVSSGPSLLIRFYANGGTGLGYKAFYSFIMGHSYDKTIQPITDCGGYVENLGGAITMIDMAGKGVKTYDCVWLIRPPKNFFHMKTHIYLKVITFSDMAGSTELSIRQGPTSALLPLEILRHPTRQNQVPRMREHVAPISSGFHVSLRGSFGPISRLAIAYAAFGYMDCFSGSDFLCQNHRCISSQLNCDGFDHCGDNSDEPSTCRDWEAEPAQSRKWHMNKANYYFPKIDRYPDLKTATLVFVASSLGLIILISALIILLYRMGARARQQRELQSRLQTISELLVFGVTDGARLDEVAVLDDPPVYEAPPGYDEVVKVGLESQSHSNNNNNNQRRKFRNFFRESRSRSTISQSSRDLETPVESTSAGRHQEVPSTHTNQVNPVNEVNIVPKSPPPPYVTPPATILHTCGIINSTIQHGDTGNSTRHDWYKNSQFSRSLDGHSKSSEELGGYNHNCLNSSPIETSYSQSMSSIDAGINLNQNYIESLRRFENLINPKTKIIRLLKSNSQLSNTRPTSVNSIKSCATHCTGITDSSEEMEIVSELNSILNTPSFTPIYSLHDIGPHSSNLSRENLSRENSSECLLNNNFINKIDEEFIYSKCLSFDSLIQCKKSYEFRVWKSTNDIFQQ